MKCDGEVDGAGDNYGTSDDEARALRPRVGRGSYYALGMAVSVVCLSVPLTFVTSPLFTRPTWLGEVAMPHRPGFANHVCL